MGNSSDESSEESESEVHTLQTPSRHTCINAQYHSNITKEVAAATKAAKEVAAATKAH